MWDEKTETSGLFSSASVDISYSVLTPVLDRVAKQRERR